MKNRFFSEKKIAFFTFKLLQTITKQQLDAKNFGNIVKYFCTGKVQKSSLVP